MTNKQLIGIGILSAMMFVFGMYLGSTPYYRDAKNCRSMLEIMQDDIRTCNDQFWQLARYTFDVISTCKPEHPPEFH